MKSSRSNTRVPLFVPSIFSLPGMISRWPLTIRRSRRGLLGWFRRNGEGFTTPDGRPNYYERICSLFMSFRARSSAPHGEQGEGRGNPTQSVILSTSPTVILSVAKHLVEILRALPSG